MQFDLVDILGLVAVSGILLAAAGLVLRIRADGLVRRRVRRAHALAVSTDPARPFRILCLGDSLTDSSWPQHLQSHLESAGLPVQVQGLGFPGANSAELLAALTQIDLTQLSPDLTILLVGTNDVRVDRNHLSTASFVANLQRLAERLLTREAATARYLALCTVPPVVPVPFHFSPDSMDRLREELNPAIRHLAARLRLPCLELADSYSVADLKPGDVHPTEAGYQSMASLAAQKLVPFVGLLTPPIGQVVRPG